MKLIFHIPAESLIGTYTRVSGLFHGNDQIIFDAMAEVTKDRTNPFIPPDNPGEFAQKHEEIKRQLGLSGILRGRKAAMDLMEEVASRIQASGGVVGVSPDEVLDVIVFDTNTPSLAIRLNHNLRWAAQWSVPFPVRGTDEVRSVSLEIYARLWGEVVPSYVTEYVKSAMCAYRQGMDAVAIALLSIAVEATLRDVLRPRGYTFNPGASRVDVYSYATADVGVEGNSYVVTFQELMPKSPAQFTLPTGGDPTLVIRVRRVVNWREGSVDLSIKAPPRLIDHWSSDTVEQRQQQRVNGLGEALDIARNQEGLLTALDLPLDLDEVIQVVRNNLVHLSGEALNTPLTAIDSSGEFTLQHFLDHPEMVYDLITNVPRFINGQYVELRRAEHRAS